MRRFAIASALLVGLAFAATAIAEDMVENPEYKMWAQVGVGSSATFRVKSDMGGMKQDIEMTMKLAELTAEKAVLNGHMKMGDKENKMPKQEVKAKITKEELEKDQKKRGKKTGTEEIEAAGKKWSCDVWENEEEKNGIKTHTKVWFCEKEWPGIIKMENTMTGNMKGTMTMSLEKIDKK